MSTWSSLKVELIGTGDQAGQWGTTTNINLGEGGAGLEQAIVGRAELVTGDFTSNSYTLSYDNNNGLQDFRALVLDITATLSAAGTVIVPAINKPYLVFNNSVGGYDVTVKVSGETGVTVPNGKKAIVFNNGTDVGHAIDWFNSLTLATPLAASSGGTGLSALGSGVATWLGTPSSANLAAAVTGETGSGALVFGSSPTITTATLTTPAVNRGVLTSAIEKATISATAATSTINFDVITQSVLYYTSNASGNWTLNVRGDGTTTLDSIMSTGQSVTLAFLVTNGATAYRQTALTVDGSSVTPKWQGGSAPSAGNTSSIDIYTLTLIKTNTSTFTALEALTKFA